MTIFLESMFVLALICGILNLIFDVKLDKVIGIFLFPSMLIILGFFFGIGIHITNLIFKW